jgi:hypothetical protein
VSTFRPPTHDHVRRQGGGGMMVTDEWSISDKGLWSPEIEDYRGRVEREFLKFSRAPQERLSWLTIIADALVVEPGDHGDAVAQSMRDMKRKLIARCRRSMPGMTIRGVFEVDVLAASACRIGRHKADLLRTLGVDVATVASDHRILVPHLHCIVDRADHTPERLAEQMKAEFPGPWRTLAAPLHSHRLLSNNLKSLAGYCTKMKVAYSDAWACRTTKYADIYEAPWVDTVRLSLSSIGLDNLYFSHGGGALPVSGTSLTAAAENPANLRLTACSTGSEIDAIDCTETIGGGGSSRAVALHGGRRDPEMQGGRLDAGRVLTPPSGNLILIRAKRTAQGRLAAMGPPGCCQRRPCRASSTVAAFLDPHSLHIRDLCEDGEDQFSHSTGDLAQSLNLDDDAPVDELAHRCLHIEGVPAQPVNGDDMKPVTVTNVAQEFSKCWTIRCRDDPAHALVNELAVETCAKHLSLSGNGLGRRGRPEICDAAHSAPWLIRYLIFMRQDHKSVKYLVSHPTRSKWARLNSYKLCTRRPGGGGNCSERAIVGVGSSDDHDQAVGVAPMTDEPLPRMIRFKIHRDAVENIHNDIANASHYFMKRIVERDRANDRAGISLEMMAALTMTAFWIEAGINYIGATKVQGWIEREAGHKKLARLLDALSLTPDMSSRPWSVIGLMKVFRDTLAHGKPEKLATEEIVVRPYGFADRPGPLESDWVKSLTVDTVVQSYEDANAIWLEMLAAAGMTEMDATSHGSSGITYIGEA